MCWQLGVWERKGAQDGLAQFLVKMSDMIFSWTSWMLFLGHSKYQYHSNVL